MLLLGHLTALAFLAELIVVLRCFRERLVISLAMAQFIIGLIRGLLPRYIALSADPVKKAGFLLWLIASGVSLSMVVSAARNENADH